MFSKKKAVKEQKYTQTMAINILRRNTHNLQNRKTYKRFVYTAAQTHGHPYVTVLKSWSFVLLYDYYYYKSVYMVPEQ